MVRQKNIGAVFMERIENSLGAGTPDFHWLLEGKAGWCELKCGVVRKERFDWLGKYTIQQRRWAKDYVAAGGLYLFCASDQHNKIWWWHGYNAIIIDAMPLERAVALCIGRDAEFPRQVLQRIKKGPEG